VFFLLARLLRKKLKKSLKRKKLPITSIVSLSLDLFLAALSASWAFL
jgi:hypothetical protein